MFSRPPRRFRHGADRRVFPDNRPATGLLDLDVRLRLDVRVGHDDGTGPRGRRVRDAVPHQEATVLRRRGAVNRVRVRPDVRAENAARDGRPRRAALRTGESAAERDGRRHRVYGADICR